MATVINPEYLSMPAQVQKNKEDIAALKESGLIVTPRGEYSDDTQYNKNDLVDSNGSSYLAIIASLGYPPASNPDRWQLIAEKGDPGAAGKDGNNGKDGTNGADGATGKVALAQTKLWVVLSDPTTVTQLTFQKSIFNREPVVGDAANIIATYGSKAWQFSGTITNVNETYCTFSYATAPAGYINIVGPQGPAGPSKVCHNVFFSKAPSQSEMIRCTFSIIDESQSSYTNLNFVYTALTGSHINAPQNHRFPATGFYMKNYISMPITSIRWSAATLRISYIDTTLEQPTETDYICTLTDTCTDCKS